MRRPRCFCCGNRTPFIRASKLPRSVPTTQQYREVGRVDHAVVIEVGMPDSSAQVPAFIGNAYLGVENRNIDHQRRKFECG